jgi:hypothetical protein
LKKQKQNIGTIILGFFITKLPRLPVFLLLMLIFGRRLSSLASHRRHQGIAASVPRRRVSTPNAGTSATATSHPPSGAAATPRPLPLDLLPRRWFDLD